MDVDCIKTIDGKHYNRRDEELIDCRLCHDFTTMLGTKLCDRCWELETRIGDAIELARRIIARIEVDELKVLKEENNVLKWGINLTGNSPEKMVVAVHELYPQKVPPWDSVEKHSVVLKDLTDKDIGSWVEYTPPQGNTEQGRIKSWNDKWVFVVYACVDDWNNYMNYTACATMPGDLTFIGKGD